MNQNSEYLKKFEQELKVIESLNLDLWKSIIMIHGVILGVSVALMGYLKAPPNLLLKSTWIIQIISIGIGFLIFYLYIEQKFKGTWASLKLSMNMNAFQLLDKRDEFVGKEEKRSGVLLAILMSQESEMIIPKEDRVKWSENAKKLAEKYKGELESSKLIKELKKTKFRAIKEFLMKHNSRFISGFYILSFSAFLTLLLSILT